VPLADFPWVVAYLVLAACWLAGPVALLIAGLIHLHQHARHQWWSALAWVGVLAAGTAIGYVIMHDYLAAGAVMIALMTARSRPVSKQEACLLLLLARQTAQQIKLVVRHGAGQVGQPVRHGEERTD
jgi:hypothetical protein